MPKRTNAVLPNVSADSLLTATLLAGNAPAFVVEWKTRRILTASNAVERVFGYRPEELRGRTTECLHADETRFRRFGEMTERVLHSEKQTFHCYFTMKRRDGTVFDSEHLLAVIRDHIGDPVAALSVVHDVAADGQRLDQPRDGLNPEFRALSENLPGGVFKYVRNPEGRRFYRYFRGDLARRLGVSSEEVAANPAQLLDRLESQDRERLDQALGDAQPDSSVDLELVARDAGSGKPRWLRAIAQSRELDDGSVVWDGVMLDLTAQRQAEQSLYEFATFDGVTGLPNVATFELRLADAIIHARRQSSRLLVVALDVARFHTVNERLGFARGDQVLRAIGERLQQAARGNDLAARHQGDRFLILFQDVESEDHAAARLHDLLAVFEEPFELERDQRLVLKARAGLSVFPDDGTTIEELRRSAELALQRVRRDPQHNYAFYSRRMTRELLDALDLERSLADAIRREALEPWYQPQYDLATGRLAGFEALARWPAPDGAVAPGRFIPLAEETGLIRPLGRLIAKRVFSDIEAWRSKGLIVPPVALNLSTHQLREAVFLDWFLETLREYRLELGDVKLEITESVFLLGFERPARLLEQFSRQGVWLSIDDFGTGFSSLGYLTELPFRELKIDRSFVEGIETDPAKRSVARGITDLGHALSMNVVAEGVENRDQSRVLQALGCDGAQGFLFSRPQPPQRFDDEIRSDVPHRVFDES